MSRTNQGATVTRGEALAFADEAFRNRDITFSGRDVVDLTAALGTFLARRITCRVTERVSREAINLTARHFCEGAGIGWENTALEYRERYRAAAAAFLTLTLEPDRFRKFVDRIAAWTDEELSAVDAKQCRHVAQVVTAGADPNYPPFGPSAFAVPSIPEGMKRWTGGDRAPADWDGGPVWLRGGRLCKKGEGPKADADGKWIEGDGNWTHLNGWDREKQVAIPGEWDVIAYTPKTAPTADREAVER